MKFCHLSLTFLLLLSAFQICFSQEKPQAVLLTEFGNVTCEELLAQTDYLITELNDLPSSQGYVIIYGENNYLRKKLAYELWINGAIKFRGFDSNRIIKIRGIEEENLRIQFWKVPAGAEKPQFKEGKWSFVFPPKTKPFIFYDEFSDQICSSMSFEKVFAEYLNANQKARGHVVIYEKSLNKYKKRKKGTQDLLRGISINQLKFFYVKSDSSNIEFWLVPEKQKK